MMKNTLAFLTALLFTALHVAAAAKPNVLFIIADDLNCDLGTYGHPLVKTPNIDRLAARGVRFERAYCQYALCGPSRASLMCGYYPDQTLIRANAIRIRERLPEVSTMSQMFRDNGYTASRIGKIYHYGVPLDIGTAGHDDPASWDTVFNPIGRDRTLLNEVFSLRKSQYGATLSWRADDGTDDDQTDGAGAANAVGQLEGFAAKKTPFFLAVGFYRPHTPYVAPKKYFDAYDREKIVIPTVPEGYLDTLPAPARATLTNKKEQMNLDSKIARQAIQGYYASISYMDAQVGRVLDALDRLGLAKNTIVVFTSDHGYHMGEHGYYQKMTLFENATRVPLIIAAPGMKAMGQATKSFAELTDLYPTLGALTGLKPPTNLSGVSLAPILEDAGATSRTDVLSQVSDGYSLRNDRYRYTEWGPEGELGVELYDHANDPAELVNLATKPEQAVTINRLAIRLRERIAAARAVPAGLKQIAGAKKNR